MVVFYFRCDRVGCSYKIIQKYHEMDVISLKIGGLGITGGLGLLYCSAVLIVILLATTLNEVEITLTALILKIS